MRADIVPGGTFPDYELPDHTETPAPAQRAAGRRPDDPHPRARPLLPEGAPAAPRAGRQLPEDRRRLHPDRHDLDRRHHTLQEFRASVGAQWPFLSDPGRIVQKDLDIQEYTDPDNDPMIPHTLVLKPGLVIHSDLQRLLVLGPPVVRRPLARPARRDARDPPGLGPEHPRPARGVGGGRRRALPRMGPARRAKRGVRSSIRTATSRTSIVTWSPTISCSTQQRTASTPTISRRASLT